MTVINNGQWSWNWSRTNLGVRNLAYLCDMLNEIGQLNIDVNEDTCTWSLGRNGTFTVKDARYRIDQNILPRFVVSGALRLLNDVLIKITGAKTFDFVLGLYCVVLEFESSLAIVLDEEMMNLGVPHGRQLNTPLPLDGGILVVVWVCLDVSRGNRILGGSPDTWNQACEGREKKKLIGCSLDMYFSSECQMVMGVLWARLTETDRNWRHVYKALAVIEYLVANGSERAVDDIIEHTFQISSLSSFEYVEPNGKDSGINVRKKVENIVSLLNDKDKIQMARNKAAANRDKYVGLSSTGISYKSGLSASFSGGSFQKSDRYGGFGGSRDGETFKDSFKNREQSSEDRFEPGKFKPRRETSSPSTGSSSKKGTSRYGSAKSCILCKSGF
ncbi:ENTH/VHS-like protein [Tanacetum coccineum]